MLETRSASLEAPASADVDPVDPHWGMVCWTGMNRGTGGSPGFMREYTSEHNGHTVLSCEHCGAWTERDADGVVVARSESFARQMLEE